MLFFVYGTLKLRRNKRTLQVIPQTQRNKKNDKNQRQKVA